MSTLHFTAHPTPVPEYLLAGYRNFVAYDSLGLMYVVYEHPEGLTSRVYDQEGNRLHLIDWRGFRTHPDEMKKKLQAYADEAQRVADSIVDPTVTVIP